jgi:alpha-D-xyloside xylohydrolase
MLTPMGIGAPQEKAGPFTRSDTRLQWQNEGQLFWIEAYGPDALRFRSSKSLRIAEESWTLLPQPIVRPEISISEDKAVVRNGRIRAEIEAKDGRVTYVNEKGEVLLREATHKHHARFARQFKTRGSDHDASIRRFEINRGGASVHEPFRNREGLLSGFSRRTT